MARKNQKLSFLYFFTLAIILIIAVLGVCNWYFQPDAALEWIKAIFILPAVWGCMTFFKWWTLKSQAHGNYDQALRHYSTAAGRFFLLIIAAIGFVKIISLIFNLGGILGWSIDPGIAGRVKIVGVGIVFILIGNALPKMITPQSLLPDGGAHRITTARRFTGWIWVLIGLAMVPVSIFLTVDLVKQTVRWMTVIGILLTLGAIIWINLGPGKDQT